jgi:hypothetical protein
MDCRFTILFYECTQDQSFLLFHSRGEPRKGYTGRVTRLAVVHVDSDMNRRAQTPYASYAAAHARKDSYGTNGSRGKNGRKDTFLNYVRQAAFV